jgi:hypothetical protein
MLFRRQFDNLPDAIEPVSHLFLTHYYDAARIVCMLWLNSEGCMHINENGIIRIAVI